MGRSRPRRMGWSFILGESAREGTVNSSRIARAFIGGGIIRYARPIMRSTLVGAALAAVVLSALTFAQQPSAIAAAEKDGIPPTILEKMDRKELGDLFRPELLPKLRPAHELLEKYFA